MVAGESPFLLVFSSYRVVDCCHRCCPLTRSFVTPRPYGQFNRRFGHRVEGVELCDCPVERLELDRRIKSCMDSSAGAIVEFLLLFTAFEYRHQSWLIVAGYCLFSTRV